MYGYMHVYVHVHGYVYVTCMCICMYPSMYVRMCLRICMYACMHGGMYVYVRMCVCVCAVSTLHCPTLQRWIQPDAKLGFFGLSGCGPEEFFEAPGEPGGRLLHVRLMSASGLGAEYRPFVGKSCSGIKVRPAAVT